VVFSLGRLSISSAGGGETSLPTAAQLFTSGVRQQKYTNTHSIGADLWQMKEYTCQKMASER
jgi:hypothetical protein